MQPGAFAKRWMVSQTQANPELVALAMGWRLRLASDRCDLVDQME
jgi:hypothetical protein